MLGSLPPFLPLLIGALPVPFLKGRVRAAYTLALPALSLANLLAIPHGNHFSVEFLDMTLTFGRVDRLSFLFGLLFHLAAFVSLLFALHVRDRVQNVAALLYAACAIGAVFAGDLFSLLMFWEGLAFTSVFLVWARREPGSFASGVRYLVPQLISGVLIMIGLALRFSAGGGIGFDRMTLDSPGTILLFIGFGVKLGFPGLHTWLTEGYPGATATGAVFLSAFTTKVAVYAMARGFAGAEALVWIGTVMAVFPIFYAVIENDLRRVLAFSMINQLGFMAVGIGVGTELGINGAVAHAFNDVFFKGLLFMSMGAVLHRTGTVNGSDLGGLVRSMPRTAALCMIGAASISAFPLFSGFVSKSMVAAAEEHYDLVWFLLLFAAAGVFHHAGIKIPYFAFFAHDSGRRVNEAPRHMLLAMATSAGMCVLIGCWPALLYGLLPFPVDYWPYDVFHVVTQFQLLFFSALAFTVLQLTGLYPPELRSVYLDVDWMFRRGASIGNAAVLGPLTRMRMRWSGFVSRTVFRPILRGMRSRRSVIELGPGAPLRTYVFVVMITLFGYLIVTLW